MSKFTALCVGCTNIMSHVGVVVKSTPLAALILGGPDESPSEWAAQFVEAVRPLVVAALEVVDANSAFHFSMQRETASCLTKLEGILVRPGYGCFFAAYYVLALACVSPVTFRVVFEAPDPIVSHAVLVEEMTSALASNDFNYKTRIAPVERWFDGISMVEDWEIIGRQRQGPL